MVDRAELGKGDMSEIHWHRDPFLDNLERSKALRSDQEGNRGYNETPWAQLARGKQLGKRAVMQYFSPVRIAPAPGNSAGVQNTPVVVLDIDGPQENALQLCLTMGPPKYIPQSSVVLGTGQTIQDIQSLLDNIDISGAGPGPIEGQFWGGQIRASTIPTGANPVLNGSMNSSIDPALPCVDLTWGIGGVRHRAQCDIGNGICLNVICNSLRVIGYVDTFQRLVTDAFYEFRANVGPGVAKPTNAQKTMSLGDIGLNTESAVFSIPRFARNVHLCGTNANHDLYNATIRFYNDINVAVNNNIVADYLFTGNAQGLINIPIPNGAYWFTVVSGINGSAQGQASQHFAVFQLSL